MGTSTLGDRAATREQHRSQGRIEERGNSLRVVVYAGDAPVTGRRTYQRATIKGTDEVAWRKARNQRTRFLAESSNNVAPHPP